MVVSTASVQTPSAARYLSQMCKHFAHKIAVDFDPETDPSRGTANFPWGTCVMQAGDGSLDMTVEAASQAEADRVAAVVDDHLKRFAWREELSVDWTPVSS